MSHRAAAALLVASLAGTGCAIGSPPGFSDGDSWSFPLVGTLEGGPLIVPVKIHDKGPYLFLIDPDSPISQLDLALAKELDLRTGLGPEFVSETDESRPTHLAEVLRITVGTLTVRNRSFFAMPAGTFNAGGREIRGLIGRDLLADSLTFGFDRDRGMGYITTQQGFHAPAGAIVVGYSSRIADESRSGVAAVSRRLTSVNLDGHKFALHVDLGDGDSQLRRSKWDGAGLVALPVERELVDETGTPRKVAQGAIARHVTVGGASRDQVLFLPYDDRRWNDADIDGTIGLNFFDGYAVWANWHTGKLHLVPRGTADLTAERIDRWGSPTLSACAAPACTTATVTVPQPHQDDTVAAQDLPPGVQSVKRMPRPQPILQVARTPEVVDQPFEVLLEARTATGEPAGLPRLLAIFPAGQRQVMQLLDHGYIGTTFAVVDVSPFVRGCPGKGACLYVLGPTE